jgi:hypothetical protein
MTKSVWFVLLVGFTAFLPACKEVCADASGAGGLLGKHCADVGDDPGGTETGGSCQSIDSAAVSLAGYAQFTPDQKRNNPEAGEPDYIYLAAGREAVVIDGPPATIDGPLQLVAPSIVLANQRATSADGYIVAASPALGYTIAIDDFEYEVALARVELCEQGGKVQSRFIFAASPDGDGVAHDITITAFVNGVSQGAPSAPATIEVR